MIENNRKQQLAHLSPEQKRALLTQLLAKKKAEHHPLSHGQQALWFLHQLAPESGAYNEFLAFRIHGNCAIAILQRSLQALVDRHPILRTVYQLQDQKPVQKVLEQQQLHFTVIDATFWSTEERERHLQQAIYQPIDLEQGPIFRAQVLKCQAEEHLLLLLVHHIAIDFWSFLVLVDELNQLYTAYKADRPFALPQLKVHYHDYVRWQAAMLASTKGAALQAYWEKQLSGPLPVLQLPTDHPRPLVQTFAGAVHAFTLDRQLSQQLRVLAQAHDVTVYTLLLSAFQVLLFRYTGQDDILVSSPTNGRTQAALDKIVGYCVNPVVLRARLAGNPAFSALLGRTQRTVIDALDHQDYPFSLLVSHLQHKRDPGWEGAPQGRNGPPQERAPYGDVAFIMEQVNRVSLSTTPELESGDGIFGDGMTGAHFKIGELDVQGVNIEQHIAKFDLALEIIAVGEIISGGFQYATDLFDATTIANLTDHFQVLLQSIVRDVEQPIAFLPLYRDQERDRILRDWNATEVSYPSELCHTLIEQQAAQTPDAIALVFEEEQISYQMLNRRANQVAQYLQSVGVAADVAVGVCMERSLEMVIALLGILKAGGAYVPLDPEYPQERLRYMLADVQAPVVLMQSRFRAKFVDAQTLGDGNVGAMHWTPICLDVEEGCLQGQSEEEAHAQIDGDHLAYIIYTSGSTGRPKGAMNTHRGILNRLRWMQDTYKLTASDRVLQKTPYSFDVSVWEFFWPLLSGATLVIAAPGEHRDSEYLVHTISEQSITTLHFVPSMLRLFLEEARVEQCQSVQRVICSGEALTGELQNRFFARLPAQLYNLYGPTEAAVDVTEWACRPEGGRSTVPIGRPIHNIQMYVLDRYAQPVPIGVAGELYIAGVGLARGYLKRPDLTAERFLPCPFSQRPGERMYRTGDLARYRADGNLEYLGRIDQQVKLRGMRIELGEIEAVLNTHPAVKQSVVILREDKATDQRLVAYMVLGGEETADESCPTDTCAQQGKPRPLPPTPNHPLPLLLPHHSPHLACIAPQSELRQFLRDQLPLYMIPAHFIGMPELPLLSNGKLNYRMLPAPQESVQVVPIEDRSLYTPTETWLSHLCATLLELPQVARQQNFFEIGGHSLMATQVLHHIRERYHIEMPLRAIFEVQNIAELAQVIDTMQLVQEITEFPTSAGEEREEGLL